MKTIISSTEILNKQDKIVLRAFLEEKTSEADGELYYKFPVAGGTEHFIPDFTLVDYDRGVIIFDIHDINLDQIEMIEDFTWIISRKEHDSPLARLEDYVVGLNSKFDRYRGIRGLVKVQSYLVLPLISKGDFSDKFSSTATNDILFKDYGQKSYDELWRDKNKLKQQQRRLFISVSQGAGKLNDNKRLVGERKASKIGEAIQLLDSKIAVLDKRQHAAAIQIPDGPQRIRGMAGTGKTVILAMKAAYLHSRFPDKKILYTFHTQSLYNQVRDLITRFYRDSEEKDPDWNNLLILHAWGGRGKEGVYYRTCLRNSLIPISFRHIPGQEEFFEYVCNEALKAQITPEFDFVLMDESQDFPTSFFRLVYEITKEPKRIIFAYDELQASVNIQDTGELFGYKRDGSKKVDFSQGRYSGEIEMDFILEKSYRNPLKVLMAAHGIGLGVYNTDAFMQIIEKQDAWEAIGYKLIGGELKKGSHVEIERPVENSASLVHEVHEGIELGCFQEREQERQWIVQQIVKDIHEEGVQPHDIVVICLKSSKVIDVQIELQKLLHQYQVPSIISGIGGVERDQFGEKGFVTLSTVFKAKGNECFVVYVSHFDHLYSYVDFVQSRNRAFTSISRSKGWCRISGIGDRMQRAKKEVDDIIANIPRFRFTFPDAKSIKRRLGTEEHAKRLAESKKVKNAARDLLRSDIGAIRELPLQERNKLIELLGKND